MRQTEVEKAAKYNPMLTIFCVFHRMPAFNWKVTLKCCVTLHLRIILFTAAPSMFSSACSSSFTFGSSSLAMGPSTSSVSVNESCDPEAAGYTVDRFRVCLIHTWNREIDQRFGRLIGRQLRHPVRMIHRHFVCRLEE
jgi:hypothetical protein